MVVNWSEAIGKKGVITLYFYVTDGLEYTASGTATGTASGSGSEKKRKSRWCPLELKN